MLWHGVGLRSVDLFGGWFNKTISTLLLHSMQIPIAKI